MARPNLALPALILQRCREIGIGPRELVERCGYKNISKGIRRLEEVYSGNFQTAVDLPTRRQSVAAPAPSLGAMSGQASAESSSRTCVGP